MTDNQYKWKGKFVTEKKYKCMKIRSENGKKRKKEPESSHIVEGHRIIDIDHVAKNMYCSFCKERLHLEDITKEIVKGAASIFEVQYKNCLKKNTVKSGKEYTNPSTGRPLFTINTKTALGVLHAGAGSTQLNKIFNCMDLPNINDQLFKKHERIIGPIVEFVAKESCSEAAIAERTLTLENIIELKKLLPEKLQDGFLILNIEPSESNPEGKIVRIFASYDMGWSQRSNGYSYDSLNGYCAIIGLKTGKILDFCFRNRKCRICNLGLVNGKIKEHDCRLNCYSSSKAMEADGAVQLVTNSNILKTANIEVGVFIGDNDSCCIASIQNAINYEIVKQSDMNHTTKSVGNTLHEIHNSKVSDPDRELSNDTIKHLQRCFTYAVKQNQGNISKVQAALKNIPYHIFGYHENCSQWCQDNADKENYTGIRVKNATLFEVLKNTFTKLADNAEKFAAATSSQANESLNNSMCSKAPKIMALKLLKKIMAQTTCGVQWMRLIFPGIVN
ncbi:uncharacterized protein LOC143906731 [Temnothorax americanus]|uniref:uncharacterized protein LOC143906731 n=1 Tax=Temnothorax americanus TaxID=1964332 RepID=UPI004067C190